MFKQSETENEQHLCINPPFSYKKTPPRPIDVGVFPDGDSKVSSLKMMGVPAFFDTYVYITFLTVRSLGAISRAVLVDTSDMISNPLIRIALSRGHP